MTGLQVIENGKIVDSSSIVPVMTVTNVTASRAFSDGDVAKHYTNNTGKTLFVLISIEHIVSVDGGYAVSGFTGNNMPIQNVGLGNNTPVGASGNTGLYTTTMYVVKPDNSYWIDQYNSNGSMTILSWIEIY